MDGNGNGLTAERLRGFIAEYREIEELLRARAQEIVDRYGWRTSREVFGAGGCDRVSFDPHGETFIMVENDESYERGDFDFSYTLPLGILVDEAELERYVTGRLEEERRLHEMDEKREFELWERLNRKYGDKDDEKK